MSGAGIMSGLTAAGGIIGGGVAVGVFVLVAPVAIQRHQGIINALKSEVNAIKERIEYLNKLNIILQTAINDLKSDMEINK